MAARPRFKLLWGAVALSAVLGAAAFVLPALRARARGEIFAKLRDYGADGQPLALAALAQSSAATDTAERLLAEFLEHERFDPGLWDPPEPAGLDAYAFEELVRDRVQAPDLSLEERELVALWLASLEVDLASIRTLAGLSLSPTASDDLATLLHEMIGVTEAFSSRAVLAAYEGDVNAVIDDLSAAFEVPALFDNHPLAIAFLGWIFCGSIALEKAERAIELLPEDADLSVLAKRLADREVEQRLRRAFEGERVVYLESLGLLRDGEIRPETEFLFYECSPWRPLSWTPSAERQVLANLRWFDLLIEEGLATTELPRPGAASSSLQTLVNMDVIAAANAHAAEIGRLRARLVR